MSLDVVRVMQQERLGDLRLATFYLTGAQPVSCMRFTDAASLQIHGGTYADAPSVARAACSLSPRSGPMCRTATAIARWSRGSLILEADAHGGPEAIAMERCASRCAAKRLSLLASG